MIVDPHTLLPRHRSDSEHTRAIVALGYPAVAPVLPELLEWLQDCNWPISRPISIFLASIGEPIIPHIRHVFAGNDCVWKYWCIAALIRKLPRAIAESLRADLTQLAYHPTVDDHSEEVGEQARKALDWLNES